MKTGKRSQMKIIKSWLQTKGLDVCGKCRGRGQYEARYLHTNFVPSKIEGKTLKMCEKCNGTGITDWVTRIRRGEK